MENLNRPSVVERKKARARDRIFYSEFLRPSFLTPSVDCRKCARERERKKRAVAGTPARARATIPSFVFPSLGGGQKQLRVVSKKAGGGKKRDLRTMRGVDSWLNAKGLRD